VAKGSSFNALLGSIDSNRSKESSDVVMVRGKNTLTIIVVNSLEKKPSRFSLLGKANGDCKMTKVDERKKKQAERKQKAQARGQKPRK
jgi:hypothetical protein